MTMNSKEILKEALSDWIEHFDNERAGVTDVDALVITLEEALEYLKNARQQSSI